MFVLASGAVFAQDSEPPVVTPTATPGPTPIPASEIVDRAAETTIVLRDAASKTSFRDELATFEGEFDGEKEHIAELEEETQRRLEIDGPASVIEEAEKVWIRVGGRLDGWLHELGSMARVIDGELERLTLERELWELTLASADEVELPPAVLQQVEETTATIVSARKRMQSNRDAILTLQTEISKEKTLVDDMLALQREEIDSRRHGMTGLDSPPLWSAFGIPGVDGAPSEQIAAVWSKNLSAVREYVGEQHRSLLRHGLFLIFLIGGLILLRNRAHLWAQQDKSLQPTVRVLGRPVAAALIITVLLGNLFHPRAPSAWHDFLGLVMLLALLRMLPRMLPSFLRPGAFLLVLLFFLRQMVRLAPDGNLVNRLALLTLSLAAAGTCVWFLRTTRQQDLAGSEGWLHAILLFSRVALLAFVIGAFANFVGNVGFATVIILSTLDSVFAAILYWVAAILLRAIVRVVLLTRLARKLAIVQLHAETVRQTLFRLITVLAVLGWVGSAISEFGALDATIASLNKIVNAEISFGDFTIIPADVLIFIVVVWLSFKISRLLRFVLDADIMPRMDLPRGVPGAITRLTHYAVVVVGVFIAASAAGLDFSRVTLIIGALGVGIGFGLQNVVNNFVSGLILLFERPIRVGDKVQIGELFGLVKNIGMRASVVRTYQGAEVIVPNANLIAAEVVNWTLSDDRRRMEIPVGVAYGTDTESVIELLVDVAKAHKDVLEDPETKAIFTGFGASSLDFELRAWTKGDYVGVSSDLLVGIEQALAAADIEIPFPQRDLHLRTKGSDFRGVAECSGSGSEATDRADTLGDEGMRGDRDSGDR
jgi:small-conductance mechanosensitive channel